MSRLVVIISLISFVILSAIVLWGAIWLANAPPGIFHLKTNPVNHNSQVALAAFPPTPRITPIAGIGGLPLESDKDIPLPTILPWPTMQNTPTSTPELTRAEAIPTLEPPQRPVVNGIPWEMFIVLSPETINHSREIYRIGQGLGRNPNRYSKVGDSTVENPHFLARFDEGPYNLGTFNYLEPAIANFRGSHARGSLAVAIGLHSWSANDPMWADSGTCLPNETPVECEIRVNNPALLFIRLGTNDVGMAGSFEANIRQIVETTIAAGVIPVIGTKGDRLEGSNENNDILRRIATEYTIPLWDYDRVADTLPGRGLDIDGAHMMTFYAHDYNDPTAFTRGHAMHNLTALMMLDALWRQVLSDKSSSYYRGMLTKLPIDRISAANTLLYEN